MNNIQKVSDAYMCSNCGACKGICPKDAIDFKWSSMGRMSAQVSDKCIDCGICTKVCPSLNNAAACLEDQYVGNIESLYTGRAVNDRIFCNAQSGGAVTAVLSYLFKNKKIDCAVVCKMTAGDTPVVQSAIITDVRDLAQTQKSCYTPVDMLSILKYTRDYESVAFVGLPCHIQGLTLLQQSSKRYHNIKYKLGLICDRTLCSSIQDLLVKKYSNNFLLKNVKIDWRRKYLSNNTFSYKNAPVVVYSDKDEHTVPNSVRFYLKEPFTPPRCRVCPDKINVMADLVFGDPWRMENIDWVKGESVIIARTSLGDKLMSEMQANDTLLLVRRNNEEIITGQLIPERKEQVAVWKAAIKILPVQMDSYLTHPSQSASDVKQISAVQSKLKTFLQMEQLQKEEVINIMLKDVNRFEKRLNSPFHRIYSGIIYRLKSLVKRILIR